MTGRSVCELRLNNSNLGPRGPRVIRSGTLTSGMLFLAVRRRRSRHVRYAIFPGFPASPWINVFMSILIDRPRQLVFAGSDGW